MSIVQISLKLIVIRSDIKKRNVNRYDEGALNNKNKNKKPLRMSV